MKPALQGPHVQEGGGPSEPASASAVAIGRHQQPPLMCVDQRLHSEEEPLQNMHVRASPTACGSVQGPAGPCAE